MRHKEALQDHSFLYSSLMGIVILGVGLITILYSTNYANVSALTSNSVTDIVLSNTRVYDVDLIFVYGAIAAILFSALVLLTIELRRLPFAMKSAGIFLVVRSVFVSVTHIRTYPVHAVIDSSFLSSYHIFQTMFMSDDLFFSLHTGLPYLMALVFWDRPWLRYVFLTISAVFGVVVLLGHLHYSIDVLGAYFITYSIYVISQRFFKKDYQRTVTAHA